MFLVSDRVVLDLKISRSVLLGLFRQIGGVIILAVLTEPFLVLGTPFFLIG